MKRSDIISGSASPIMNLFRKGLLHGAGYDTDRFKSRPLLAVANSHTEPTTGHAHLDRLGRKVKEGILAAGGMPAVLKQFERFLDTSCMTVTGKPLQATIEAARVLNDVVIPPVEKAFRPISAITVLRCLGPKGAPGMPEMLGATMALKMTGLKQAALITDGRFSGATSGPCVGHICPEASDGGPIALVEDGDLIEIDVPGRRLVLHVDEATLAKRRAAWKPLERDVPDGFMRRYRKYVRPACEGAVLD